MTVLLPKSSYRPSAPQLLSLVEDNILDALRRYHFLTSEQVCRLFFGRGSLSYARTRLKKLEDGGFCLRTFLPRPSPHGSAPAVFSLTKRGLKYLEALGRCVPDRFRPSEQSAHSYLFLSHTLCLNDLVICAELAARRFDEIELAEARHERDLKRAPVYVTVGDSKVGVVPDAWLDIRFRGAQFCYAVELDTGTEDRKILQRKIRGYLRYVEGPYQEAFGTESLTVLFATTAGHRRLRDLVDWTERVLAESDTAKQQADLFRLAAFNPAALDPPDLFFRELWVRPLATDRLTLL